MGNNSNLTKYQSLVNSVNSFVDGDLEWNKVLSIAKDIDPDYANALGKAVKNKLNILCYDCKFTSKGIKLDKRIKYIN